MQRGEDGDGGTNDRADGREKPGRDEPTLVLIGLETAVLDACAKQREWPAQIASPGRLAVAGIGGRGAGGRFVGLVGDHIRIGRLDRLAELRPELVLLTLLPYLGFSEARRWANEMACPRGAAVDIPVRLCSYFRSASGRQGFLVSRSRALYQDRTVPPVLGAHGPCAQTSWPGGFPCAFGPFAPQRRRRRRMKATIGRTAGPIERSKRLRIGRAYGVSDSAALR
jgi:hypothetical protein